MRWNDESQITFLYINEMPDNNNNNDDDDKNDYDDKNNNYDNNNNYDDNNEESEFEAYLWPLS